MFYLFQEDTGVVARNEIFFLKVLGPVGLETIVLLYFIECKH